MIRYIMAVAALFGAMMLPAAAQAASEGYTTADVNMRAGPSTEYPRIIVLPRGAPVLVYGCVRDYTWCDTAYYGERGWVSSRYINIFYDDRRVYVPYTPRVQVPIITFDFGYWDTWYPRRPWYRDYRWRRGWDADRRGGGTIYRPRDRQGDVQQFRPRANEPRWVPQNRQEDADRRPNRQRDRNRQSESPEQRQRILRPYSDSPEEAIRQQRQQRQERSQRQERREERSQRQERQERPQRQERQERRQRDGQNRGDCVWINGRCEVPR